ncbi:MAG: hypothetical protein ACYC7E_23010 [Armatimonadota bacterium]
MTQLQLFNTDSSTWKLLNTRHAKWVQSLRKDTRQKNLQEESASSAESSGVLDYYLMALSLNTERPFSFGKDLEIIKKLITATLEAAEEGILSEPEASALVDYIASKFIDRCLTDTIQCVLDRESPHSCSFYSFKGILK